MYTIDIGNTSIATSSKSGLMSASDKRKLDGIPEGAQAYEPATNDQDGLLSKEDKEKLDGIEVGAQVNSITGIKGDNESVYRRGRVNLTAENIGAASKNHNHEIATPDTDGFMSKETFVMFQSMSTKIQELTTQVQILQEKLDNYNPGGGTDPDNPDDPNNPIPVAENILIQSDESGYYADATAEYTTGYGVYYDEGGCYLNSEDDINNPTGDTISSDSTGYYYTAEAV